MPVAASSMSAVSSTRMKSLPPISRIARLIQIWPGTTRPAFSLIWTPTSREPVNAMSRVFGFSTRALPTVEPPPVRKFRTPSGTPASSQASRNIVAMPAASEEGFSTTVLPATSAAVVMPQRIARGKFHGGMTTHTPSGMCSSSLRSPG